VPVPLAVGVCGKDADDPRAQADADEEGPGSNIERVLDLSSSASRSMSMCG
jgi:hypothetical protein